LDWRCSFAGDRIFCWDEISEFLAEHRELVVNSQTSWIAAMLFIGFVVYITIKGQLSQFKTAIFNGKNAVTQAAEAAGNPTGKDLSIPSVPNNAPNFADVPLGPA
jgi:hypothetical protein